MTENLVNALTDTRALQLAPAGEMFWYTSGTIGPYYINTHYLYGGQLAAEELLSFIDDVTEDRVGFARKLAGIVATRYQDDAVFAAVVDALVGVIRDAGAEDFDFVSGGERRDWFFSTAAAHVLEKPHLLIFKDQALYLDDGHACGEVTSMAGKRIVHVADLVTEASSYFRAWIPAIRGVSGDLVRSVNVIDRGQGGVEALRQNGIPTTALLRVDEGLFEQLFRSGKIDREQADALCGYYRDPQQAMASFLQGNKQFLRSALGSSTGNSAQRARLMIETNPYDLDIEALTA